MKPGATGSEPAAMIALTKRMTFAPSAVSTRTVLGEVNWPSPVTTVTLRCLARPVRPPVKRLTTAYFQPRIAVEVEGRRAEADAMRAHRLGFVDDFGDMQKRLRGNAADIEADAAKRRALIDQHDILPEIGGAEGGGVAAGAGAENQNVGLEIGLPARVGRRLRRRASGRAALGAGSWISRPPPLSRRGRGGAASRRSRRVGREQVALADLVADLDAGSRRSRHLRAPAPRSSPCRFRASRSARPCARSVRARRGFR